MMLAVKICCPQERIRIIIKMARITIIIPDETKVQLEQIAQDEDRNLSYVVRKAIQEYLDKQDK